MNNTITNTCIKPVRNVGYNNYIIIIDWFNGLLIATTYLLFVQLYLIVTRIVMIYE